MKNRYLRAILAVVIVTGIALLAGGQVAWAGQEDSTPAEVSAGQDRFAMAQIGKPGSVKPPPREFSACENGLYSVGGVVTLEIKDLKPGYCVEAVLWNPRFQVRRLPDGVGSPLAHMLFLRVYLNGRLVYEVLPGDGTVETCYALPPDKQGQFYFYDFYGKRFNKRTELPRTWDTLETTIDDQNKTACAFTQVSGVYGLIGK